MVLEMEAPLDRGIMPTPSEPQRRQSQLVEYEILDSFWVHQHQWIWLSGLVLITLSMFGMAVLPMGLAGHELRTEIVSFVSFLSVGADTHLVGNAPQHAERFDSRSASEARDRARSWNANGVLSGRITRATKEGSHSRVRATGSGRRPGVTSGSGRFPSVDHRSPELRARRGHGLVDHPAPLYRSVDRVLGNRRGPVGLQLLQLNTSTVHNSCVPAHFAGAHEFVSAPRMVIPGGRAA